MLTLKRWIIIYIVVLLAMFCFSEISLGEEVPEVPKIGADVIAEVYIGGSDHSWIKIICIIGRGYLVNGNGQVLELDYSCRYYRRKIREGER